MLQPPAEQQEEGAEPRRTREFITRRHSRLVDEKSLLEFVEQYSPLAKSKRRGIESTTSDDIENAHPNSPTLSGSPRPTKRRSLDKEGILIGGFLSVETLNFFPDSLHTTPEKDSEDRSILQHPGEHQVLSGHTPEGMPKKLAYGSNT